MRSDASDGGGVEASARSRGTVEGRTLAGCPTARGCAPSAPRGGECARGARRSGVGCTRALAACVSASGASRLPNPETTVCEHHDSATHENEKHAESSIAPADVGRNPAGDSPPRGAAFVAMAKRKNRSKAMVLAAKRRGVAPAVKCRARPPTAPASADLPDNDQQDSFSPTTTTTRNGTMRKGR